MNYDLFNVTAKVVDRQLAKLGGTRAMNAAYTDEATGLEDVVEPWVGSVVLMLADVGMGKGGGGSAMLASNPPPCLGCRRRLRHRHTTGEIQGVVHFV